MKKDKKRGFIIWEININFNKISYEDKRLELLKNIWWILKRKNIWLFCKFYYFLKFFIEKIYIDIFLCIINIFRINV